MHRPPLWSLLFIIPGSLFLAPMVATWLGWLISALAGSNSSMVWYYVAYIQLVRFALLILLSLAGLILWQYIASMDWEAAGNEGAPIFIRPRESHSVISWLLLPASLLSSLLLRIVGLGQSFTYDEIFTLQNFVHLPSLDKVMATYSTVNNHILYSVLAWVVARFLGEGEIALRIPAVIFGVAGVYAIYALGRELFGWKEGIIAALLLSFSLWHVYFSQEARGYSAAAFFAAASTYFLVKGMARNSLRAWLLYIVCIALGLYSNLTFTLIVAAHLGLVVQSGVNLRYHNERLRGFKGFAAAWLGGMVVSAILYASVLRDVAANIRLLIGRELVGFENLIVAYLAAVGDIVGWVSGDSGGISELVVLLAAGAGLAGISRESEAAGIRRLFGWIAAVSLVAMLVLVARHFFYARFFIVLLPFYVLAIARGVTFVMSKVKPGFRVAAGLGIALALFVPQLHGYWLYFQSGEQDIRGVAKYLKTEGTPSDMVVVAGLGWQELAHYYDRPVHHPNTLPELSKLVAKEQPSRVFIVILFGSEEKGPLARWARAQAGEASYFPPSTTDLQLTTIEVLKLKTPLVVFR